MTRTTIKHIAEASGVSQMTVSNVINGRKSKASEATIKKINDAIKKLNYRPNMSARSLASSASKMVGVVIPFTENQNQLLLDNPFYAEMISGIESALRAQGYYMMLAGVGRDNVTLDVISHWNVDALIVLGIYPEGLYDLLKTMKLPTLLIDSYIEDDHFYHLRIDDEQAAYEATNYLISQGHKDIALVTGVIREDGVIKRRLAGYNRALSGANITPNPDYIFEGSVGFDWGKQAADELMKHSKISAAFCTADLIAAGLLAGLHKNGKQIPQDISVMGFDNISISQMVYPALTTMGQEIVSKGKIAADLMTSLLNKKPVKREVETEVEIIIRDSVTTFDAGRVDV